MSDVWTFGETMISLRAASILSSGGTWTTHVAGAESNVAIGLSRLAHSVTWCSRVGDDAFGRLILRELAAEGVTVDCEVDASAPTGFMFLRPTSFGSEVEYQRTGSAAAAMTARVTESLTRAHPSLVTISGITPALGPSTTAATLRAAQTAQDLGAKVVLDVNYRSKLWSRSRAADFLKEIARHVDVLIGSPDEVDLLAASCGRALEHGPSEVVVKLGAAGAELHTAEGMLTGPTRAVDAVDPVGAGDAFTAGYVSAMLDELGPADRLRRANAMGAAAVSHVGDFEGLPTRTDLLAWEGSQQDVTR